MLQEKKFQSTLQSLKTTACSRILLVDSELAVDFTYSIVGR